MEVDKQYSSVELLTSLHELVLTSVKFNND